jgi:hypothetical protein
MDLQPGELIPAVTATGFSAPTRSRIEKQTRKRAESDRRIAWNKLFFEASFDNPLAKNDAGEFGLPLEMLRIGPSASNQQPWRIVKQQDNYHLYMHRSPGSIWESPCVILNSAQKS